MVLKNKKGQLMVLGLMIAVFVFFTAIILIDPLIEGIDIGRTELNCTNESISTGQKATCLIVDLYLPYFIGAVLAGSVFLVFYKVSGG